MKSNSEIKNLFMNPFLVFGSLEYFIENDQVDTGFTSIPQV